jgi:hypothetical protein
MKIFVSGCLLTIALLEIGCERTKTSSKEKVMMLGEAYDQDCESTSHRVACSSQNYRVEQEFMTAFASDLSCNGIKLLKTQALHDGKTKSGLEVDFPVTVYLRRDSWHWFSGDFTGDGKTAHDVADEICKVAKDSGGEIVH